MKIDRILSIVMILMERYRVSATELAKMFEVTTRTIYRDIDAISLAGIPIVTYTGVKGGIGIMERYKTDKRIFTKSDISTLLMGLGGFPSAVTGSSMNSTIAKIQSFIPEEHLKEIELKSRQISIDMTPWAGNRNLENKLKKIRDAMDCNVLINFKYSNLKRENVERKVEPYQLIIKSGSWYLRAYCLVKEDFRIFKLIRISDLSITECKFKEREYKSESLNDDGWIIDRVITIKLLINKSLEEEISERWGEDTIKPYDDKRLLAFIPFTFDDYGFSQLLGYGDKCECIEPVEVRDELIRRIKSNLMVYN